MLKATINSRSTHPIAGLKDRPSHLASAQCKQIYLTGLSKDIEGKDSLRKEPMQDVRYHRLVPGDSRRRSCSALRNECIQLIS